MDVNPILVECRSPLDDMLVVDVGRALGAIEGYHDELRRAQMLVRMESEKMGVCKVSSSSRLDDLVHQCVFYD